MSATLKPCPFCQGEMMERWALWPSDGDSDAIIHDQPTNCPMSGFSNGTADKSIVERWNRRADGWKPKVTDAAIEAAANVFSAHGLHISLPSEGDMDDLERERYDGLRLALEAAFAAEAS